MGEPNNGQSERAKPKRHNAKLCPAAIRQRVVHALANGESYRSIAKRLHVSRNTIRPIHEQEWNQVEQLKQRRINQWERVADTTLDNLNDQLEANAHKLAPNQLATIAGIATDKLIALRSDPALTIRHEHLHATLSDDDLRSFIQQRAKVIASQSTAAIQPTASRAANTRISQANSNTAS